MKKNIISKEKKTLHSFEELGEAYGLKPRNKQTKDKEKLESQRKRMSGTCRVCGSQLKYVPGTNVFYCQNEECKGIERVRVDEDGNVILKSKQQVYRTVDKKGTYIANILFEEN